jgi:hypothetical protein
MSRRKPHNNGKPRKTEPGAIRFISKNHKVAPQDLKKRDENE